MHSIGMHFAKREPNVRAAYDEIVRAAQSFGPVKEEAKKTSIHLVRRTAFAGIITRRSWLILTIKSDADIEHPRITKREQASANRWHVETRIEGPKQVDVQLKRWLRRAYELAQ